MNGRTDRAANVRTVNAGSSSLKLRLPARARFAPQRAQIGGEVAQGRRRPRAEFSLFAHQLVLELTVLLEFSRRRDHALAHVGQAGVRAG